MRNVWLLCLWDLCWLNDPFKSHQWNQFGHRSNGPANVRIWWYQQVKILIIYIWFYKFVDTELDNLYADTRKAYTKSHCVRIVHVFIQVKATSLMVLILYVFKFQQKLTHLYGILEKSTFPKMIAIIIKVIVEVTIVLNRSNVSTVFIIYKILEICGNWYLNNINQLRTWNVIKIFFSKRHIRNQSFTTFWNFLMLQQARQMDWHS